MQIGIGGILTIIFVICKLAGVIDWSWLWVLSPLWIGFCVAVFFMLVFGGLAAWIGSEPRSITVRRRR